MASKNFSGVLRDPLGTLASNDKYRFTHVSTTGEVIRGSTSYLTIGDDGVYNIDIEYGNVSIESYSELGKRWIAQGTTTINSDTVVSTLPALLNALVPASDALILQLEALLSDAESAAESAVSSAAIATDAASSASTDAASASTNAAIATDAATSATASASSAASDATSAESDATSAANSATTATDAAVSAESAADRAEAAADNLGTAAAADVTTSPTDTTEGRVLTVGDFGVGSSVGVDYSDKDLNDVSVGISGYFTNTTTNTPKLRAFGVFSYTPISTGGGVMTATRSTDESMFYRIKKSNIWQPWQEIYDSGNTNFNDFGSNSNTNGIVATGFAQGPEVARFYLPINSYAKPTGVTITSTFKIITPSFGVRVSNISSMTVNSESTEKVLSLMVDGLSSSTLTLGEPILLVKESGESKIKVNF